MESGTPGKRSPNAKSDIPAGFYRHFPHGVSRPKFSKVDQSIPGVGPKYRGPLETFVRSNVTYLQCFSVQWLSPPGSVRGTAVEIFSSETLPPRAMR